MHPVGTLVRVVMHPNTALVGRIGQVARAYGPVLSLSRGRIHAYGVHLPNSCGPKCGPRCWTHPCLPHEIVRIDDPDSETTTPTELTLESAQ